MPYSRTISGRKFCAKHVDQLEVNLEDIAHSLSQINRYNGHINAPYSVAQHSVLVADIVCDVAGTSKNTKMAALLHDAAEAYVGDLTPGIKPFLKDFISIESEVQSRIHSVFGITDFDEKLVDEVDCKVQNDEIIARAPWFSLETRGIDHYPNFSIPEISWWQAKMSFISKFKSICQGR